jgi:hypothetical protein
MMNEEEEPIAKIPQTDILARQMIQVGSEVQPFFATNLGKYILDRAAQAADEAMTALIDVPASDTHMVRHYQDQIKIATKAISWLEEILVEGFQTSVILEEEENNYADGV